MTEIDLIFKTN